MAPFHEIWNFLLDFVTLGAERGNPFALSVLLLAGGVALLAGRRLFWVFAAVVGYVLGAAIAPLIVSPLPGLYSVLQTGLAVLAALLAAAASRTTARLVAFLGLAQIGLLLVGPQLLPWWGEVLAAGLAGVAGLALLSLSFDGTLIALSAFYGAVAVLGASARLFPALLRFENGLYFVIVLAAGVLVQTLTLINERRNPLLIPVTAGGVKVSKRRALRRRERTPRARPPEPSP